MKISIDSFSHLKNSFVLEKTKTIQQGDFSMNDLKLYFINIKKERLLRRYGDTKINFNNYFEITGDGKPIRYLTDEEFRAGKPGYVLAKFIIN